jgi:hypothetical protein
VLSTSSIGYRPWLDSCCESSVSVDGMLPSFTLLITAKSSRLSAIALSAGGDFEQHDFFDGENADIRRLELRSS